MISKIKYFLKRPLQLPIVLFTKFVPYFRFLYETHDYVARVPFESWFRQKFFRRGDNSRAYWPINATSTVYNPEKILVGVDAYPGYMGGCYITGRGGLTIGDYTRIAPNVVIVTANHDLYDSREYDLKPVNIGAYCWLGAGVKVMPGVTLGDFTIAGAGAVITKSFEDGYCVIAGNPARKIKDLDKEKCIRYEAKHRFRGFIPEEKFEAYRKKHLKI